LIYQSNGGTSELSESLIIRREVTLQHSCTEFVTGGDGIFDCAKLSS